MVKLDRSLYLDMMGEEKANKKARRKKIGAFASSNPREARNIFGSLLR
jgi:hypothetical protein